MYNWVLLALQSIHLECLENKIQSMSGMASLSSLSEASIIRRKYNGNKLMSTLYNAI